MRCACVRLGVWGCAAAIVCAHMVIACVWWVRVFVCVVRVSAVSGCVGVGVLRCLCMKCVCV